MLHSSSNYQDFFLCDTPLLDVRAPIEFSKGSFPDAANIPLLDDAERHEIGVVYKQSGQDAAIRLGNKLVSGEKKERLILRWQDFANTHSGCHLFCFRGGLRSRTAQQWLAETGVECPLVVGGYKAMRRYLMDELERCAKCMSFVVVAGRTGSGKTLALQKIARMIDLEGMAKHRGSSFGAMTVAQPGNIDFENALSIELLKQRLAGTNPVFLEDEGKTIGSVCIPLALRNIMPGLPAVILDAPLSCRVEVSFEAYIVDLLAMYQKREGAESGFRQFVNHHELGLERIRKRFGGDNYKQTSALLRSAVQLHQCNNLDGYRPYIAKLLVDYYDPMYDYQISRKKRDILFRGSSDEIIEWANSYHPN